MDFWNSLEVPLSKRDTFILLIWKKRDETIFQRASNSVNLPNLCICKSAEFQALLSSTVIRTTHSMNIAWTSPPSRWMKLNTDGSASGNPGHAGARGVLRNELGRCIRGFALFLGTTNTLVAELWAIREGLVMAKSLGVRSLWVELDAKGTRETLPRVSGAARLS
ncbi:hypothetical protein CRG98_045225 [Punica granatum]|uniref:RNase H type-1 domain-containing protein n=1 Tax=Punica granatum TaxID=22663 RepID=A0A2I0HRP2_PUNGR|nr:hypothetical protein CRG98_045225 [Punica granatum]